MPVGARKWMIISILVGVMSFLIAGITYIMTYDNVYKGVCVANVNLGGKSRDEAERLLRETFITNDKKILFQYKDNSFEIPANELEIFYDYQKTLSDVMDYGRKGSFFGRIYDIVSAMFCNKAIDPEIKLNVNTIESILNKNLSEFVAHNIKNIIRLENDCICVTNGKKGMAVDVGGVVKSIRKNLCKNDFSACNKVSILLTSPPDITYEMLRDMFQSEKKDFVYEIRDGKFYYEPSKSGITIQREIAEKILAENIANENTYKIPVDITKPDKDIKYFADNYIIDELGDFTTIFNSSNSARSENIRLASDKINGVLLEPGEEFSFNAIVGKRDEQNGFKTAKVYQSGEVVDGVGGGICQVSSTLFNAVLYADLEIVKRTNHSMPVSYVDNGRDATVSYEQIDFVFRNSKTYPIRIESVTYNGNITCKIMGINEDNKKVEITTEVIQKIPCGTKVKKTASLYEGKRRIIKAGQPGMRVNTYKTVIINGKRNERLWVCESYYAPIDALVEIGTKKATVYKPRINKENKIPDRQSDDEEIKASSDNTEKKIVQYPLPPE